MANATWNSSNTSFLHQFVYGNKIPWTVAFSVQFLTTIILNPLIVWIVYKDNRLKTTTNYLVANMAVSDVLAAVFVFPHRLVSIHYGQRWLIPGNFGNVLCKLNNTLLVPCFGVSLYSSVFIAVERYYAVVHPMKRPFENRIKRVIFGLWIGAAISSSPNLYLYGSYQYDSERLCHIPTKLQLINRVLILTAFAINASISLPILAICYPLTIYKLYKHKLPGQQSNATVRRREQQTLNVVKMSVTIIALFCLSWGGYFLVQFLLYELKLNRHISRSTENDINNGSNFLLFMILVYNFFVYLLFNGTYRENIKSMWRSFCFKFCCRGNRVLNDIGRGTKQESHSRWPGNDRMADRRAASFAL